MAEYDGIRQEMNSNVYHGLMVHGGMNEFNRDVKIPQIMADFNASIDKLIELDGKTENSTVGELTDPRDVADAFIAAQVVYTVFEVSQDFFPSGENGARYRTLLGIDTLYTDTNSHRGSDIAKDNEHLGNRTLERVQMFYERFNNGNSDTYGVDNYAVYSLNDEVVSISRDGATGEYVVRDLDGNTLDPDSYVKDENGNPKDLDPGYYVKDENGNLMDLTLANERPVPSQQVSFLTADTTEQRIENWLKTENAFSDIEAKKQEEMQDLGYRNNSDNRMPASIAAEIEAAKEEARQDTTADDTPKEIDALSADTAPGESVEAVKENTPHDAAADAAPKDVDAAVTGETPDSGAEGAVDNDTDAGREAESPARASSDNDVAVSFSQQDIEQYVKDLVDFYADPEIRTQIREGVGGGERGNEAVARFESAYEGMLRGIAGQNVDAVQTAANEIGDVLREAGLDIEPPAKPESDRAPDVARESAPPADADTERMPRTTESNADKLDRLNTLWQKAFIDPTRGMVEYRSNNPYAIRATIDFLKEVNHYSKDEYRDLTGKDKPNNVLSGILIGYTNLLGACDISNISALFAEALYKEFEKRDDDKVDKLKEDVFTKYNASKINDILKDSNNDFTKDLQRFLGKEDFDKVKTAIDRYVTSDNDKSYLKEANSIVDSRERLYFKERYNERFDSRDMRVNYQVFKETWQAYKNKDTVTIRIHGRDTEKGPVSVGKVFLTAYNLVFNSDVLHTITKGIFMDVRDAFREVAQEKIPSREDLLEKAPNRGRDAAVEQVEIPMDRRDGEVRTRAESDGSVSYFDKDDIKVRQVSHDRNTGAAYVDYFDRESLKITHREEFRGNGGFVEHRYDRDGNEYRQIEKSADGHNVTERDLDKDGNITKQTEKIDGNVDRITVYGRDIATGKLINLQYFDKEYRLVQSVDFHADGSSVEKNYDADGKLKSEVEYDKKGNPLVEREYRDDVCIKETEHTPDGKEERYLRQDGNVDRAVVYDKDGNINRVEKYSYNENGDLEKKTSDYYDKDKRFTEEYDKDGKVIGATIGDIPENERIEKSPETSDNQKDVSAPENEKGAEIEKDEKTKNLDAAREEIGKEDCDREKAKGFLNAAGDKAESKDWLALGDRYDRAKDTKESLVCWIKGGLGEKDFHSDLEKNNPGIIKEAYAQAARDELGKDDGNADKAKEWLDAAGDKADKSDYGALGDRYEEKGQHEQAIDAWEKGDAEANKDKIENARAALEKEESTNDVEKDEAEKDKIEQEEDKPQDEAKEGEVEHTDGDPQDVDNKDEIEHPEDKPQDEAKEGAVEHPEGDPQDIDNKDDVERPEDKPQDETQEGKVEHPEGDLQGVDNKDDVERPEDKPQDEAKEGAVERTDGDPKAITNEEIEHTEDKPQDEAKEGSVERAEGDQAPDNTNEIDSSGYNDGNNIRAEKEVHNDTEKGKRKDNDDDSAAFVTRSQLNEKETDNESRVESAEKGQEEASEETHDVTSEGNREGGIEAGGVDGATTQNEDKGNDPIETPGTEGTVSRREGEEDKSPGSSPKEASTTDVESTDVEKDKPDDVETTTQNIDEAKPEGQTTTEDTPGSSGVDSGTDNEQVNTPPESNTELEQNNATMPEETVSMNIEGDQHIQEEHSTIDTPVQGEIENEQPEETATIKDIDTGTDEQAEFVTTDGTTNDFGTDNEPLESVINDTPQNNNSPNNTEPVTADTEDANAPEVDSEEQMEQNQAGKEPPQDSAVESEQSEPTTVEIVSGDTSVNESAESLPESSSSAPEGNSENQEQQNTETQNPEMNIGGNQESSEQSTNASEGTNVSEIAASTAVSDVTTTEQPATVAAEEVQASEIAPEVAPEPDSIPPEQAQSDMIIANAIENYDNDGAVDISALSEATGVAGDTIAGILNDIIGEDAAMDPLTTDAIYNPDFLDACADAIDAYIENAYNDTALDENDETPFEYDSHMQNIESILNDTDQNQQDVDLRNEDQHQDVQQEDYNDVDGGEEIGGGGG